MKLLLFLITLYLFSPTDVFANLNLLEPGNLALIEDNSPTLRWSYDGSCPGGNVSCFRVEVDDNQDFSSLNKSTYTSNFSYTPQDLEVKTWYWRVKSKDLSGNWSEFVNSSFTIEAKEPAPSPSPSSSPSASGNSSGSTESDNSSNQLIFSGFPANISSTRSYVLDVKLSGLTPNSKYFLKGAFYANGSTNYFGKTKVGTEWIKNSASTTSQFSFISDSLGSWQGQIEVMVDEEDSGFSGGGNYNFKVARYNSSGASLYWSEFTQTYITKDSISTPKPAANSDTNRKSNSTTKPSASLNSLSTKSIAATNNSKSLSKTDLSGLKIASIEAEMASSGGISEVLGESVKNKNYSYSLILLGSILVGISSFILVKLIKKS